MTTAGSQDAPIEIFGGLVTDMSPADLPHGVSPDCQDVIFSNGGVATRPGLQALFGPLAANPTINYVKTYETLNATLRTMLLDSNGVLYKETTPGTLAPAASKIPKATTVSTGFSVSPKTTARRSARPSSCASGCISSRSIRSTSRRTTAPTSHR